MSRNQTCLFVGEQQQEGSRYSVPGEEISLAPFYDQKGSQFGCRDLNERKNGKKRDENR